MSSSQKPVIEPEDAVRWVQEELYFRLNTARKERLLPYHQKCLWIARKVLFLDSEEAARVTKDMPHKSKMANSWSAQHLDYVVWYIERSSRHCRTSNSQDKASVHWKWVFSKDSKMEEELRVLQKTIDDERISHHLKNGSIVLRVACRRKVLEYATIDQKFIYHVVRTENLPGEAIGNSLRAIGVDGTDYVNARTYGELVRYIREQKQNPKDTFQRDHWKNIVARDDAITLAIRKYAVGTDQGVQSHQSTQHGGYTALQSPPTDLRGKPVDLDYVSRSRSPPQQVSTGFNPAGPAVNPDYAAPQPTTIFSQGAEVSGQQHPEDSMLIASGQSSAHGITSNYQAYSDYQTGLGNTIPAHGSRSTSSAGYTQYKQVRGTSRAPESVAMPAYRPTPVQTAVDMGSGHTKPLQARSGGISDHKRRRQNISQARAQERDRSRVQAEEQRKTQESPGSIPALRVYEVESPPPDEITGSRPAPRTQRAFSPLKGGIMEKNWGGDMQGLLQSQTPESARLAAQGKPQTEKRAPGTQTQRRQDPEKRARERFMQDAERRRQRPRSGGSSRSSPDSERSSQRHSSRPQTPAEEEQSQKSQRSITAPKHYPAHVPKPGNWLDRQWSGSERTQRSSRRH